MDAKRPHAHDQEKKPLAHRQKPTVLVEGRIWYTWTAPASGTVNIGTYDTITSAPTMRAVAIYNGDALGSLTEIASSNGLAQLEYTHGGSGIWLTDRLLVVVMDKQAQGQCMHPFAF